MDTEITFPLGMLTTVAKLRIKKTTIKILGSILGQV